MKRIKSQEDYLKDCKSSSIYLKIESKSNDVENYVGLVNDKPSLIEVSDNGFYMHHEILSDKSPSGRERPWRPKKINNMLLQQYYKDIAQLHIDELDAPEEFEYWYKRSERLKKCSSHLIYNKYSDGSKKLKSMKACKIRLCPVCTWRRSMKIHYQSRAIFEQLEKEHSGEYDVLMFTLTIPNCYGGQLSDQITLLLKSFDKLLHRCEFKRYNKKTKKVEETFWGWYRGLEVTHDNNEYITAKMYYNKKRHGYYVRHGLKIGDKNPSYDTYHPHLHVLFVAPKSYLLQRKVDRGYITPEMLLNMWREVTGIDRITQIHIDEIQPKENVSNSDDLELSKNGIVNAICETTKYTVKECDYIAPWNWVLSLRTIMVLDKALFRRRLVAWGGILKDYHKQLNLDDVVDGDLVNVGESTPTSELVPEKIHAFWNFGYNQYFVGDWQYI